MDLDTRRAAQQWISDLHLTPRHTIIDGYGQRREVGVIGYRINTITPEGAVIGLMRGDTETPPAQCRRRPGVTPHPAPDLHCRCGWRIVTDLATLLAHQVELPPTEVWGAYRARTTNEREHHDHRILLQVATEPNRPPLPPSQIGDPHGTLRSRRLLLVGPAWLRRSDAHLAAPIAARYPLHVRVLESDDFAEIHDYPHDHQPNACTCPPRRTA